MSGPSRERLEGIPLRRMPTDVPALLRRAMEALSQQAKENDIDLHIEASADVPTSVLVDAQKIAWAVTALVGNGLRYVKRGTRRMPGGSIVVKIRFDADANALVIAVVDDGPGIPAEKVPRLFEPANETAHSAGLALMLIHDVVVAHDGTIDVQSITEGFEHGTTVTMKLPTQ